jgi:hypothetical protein
VSRSPAPDRLRGHQSAGALSLCRRSDRDEVDRAAGMMPGVFAQMLDFGFERDDLAHEVVLPLHMPRQSQMLGAAKCGIAHRHPSTIRP